MIGASAPRVSVVMSVYNGMPLVRDAVASILAQTMPDFEFMIVNDGSTDDTLDWLRGAAAADPRIRIIDQANTGLTRALIAGVAAARAPVIARMDADDWSAPERLALQLAMLDRDPGLCAVSSGIEYVRDDLVRVGVTEHQLDSDVWPLMITFFNAIGGHGQMMFRRDAYEAAGGYDPHFRFSQDYDLWSRMLRHGRMGEAPGLLYRFRVGHDSISTRHGDLQRALAAEIAAREYRLLTGAMPDDAIVHAVLALFGARLHPFLPLVTLTAIDRHIGQAFASHEKRLPGRRPDLAAARRMIGKAWLRLLPFVPARDAARWSLILRIAARWDPATLPSAILARVIQPLRAAMARD